MSKLYRSNWDLQHWFVRIPGIGWARFPAKINGWAEHRLITIPIDQRFDRVPLWMAFNTGLLEALKQRALDRAAA